MLKTLKSSVCLISLAISTVAFAQTHTVTMNFTSENGTGNPAGTITISETKYGLLFTPNLHGLKPGIHGFHIHQNPSCGKDGMDAGGHLDPQKTEKHLGPFNEQGHLGDLPALYVASDGTSTLPVLAPRLKRFNTVKNHSLMVHEGGDNYSDTPTLGGGGHRMICGIID